MANENPKGSSYTSCHNRGEVDHLTQHAVLLFSVLFVALALPAATVPVGAKQQWQQKSFIKDVFHETRNTAAVEVVSQRRFSWHFKLEEVVIWELKVSLPVFHSFPLLPINHHIASETWSILTT
eukprot:scaffold437_cov168-Ochromonas_danica.AAC.21